MGVEREFEDRMEAGFIPGVEVSCIDKSASNSPFWNVFSCPYFRSIPRRGHWWVQKLDAEVIWLQIRTASAAISLAGTESVYFIRLCEGKGAVIQHTIGLYSFVPSCFRDTRDVPGIVVWPGMQCQLTRGWTIDARCRLKQTDCEYNWEPNGTFNAVHSGTSCWPVLPLSWYIVVHEAVTWALHCLSCSPQVNPQVNQVFFISFIASLFETKSLLLIASLSIYHHHVRFPPKQNEVLQSKHRAGI